MYCHVIVKNEHTYFMSRFSNSKVLIGDLVLIMV